MVAARLFTHGKHWREQAGVRAEAASGSSRTRGLLQSMMRFASWGQASQWERCELKVRPEFA